MPDYAGPERRRFVPCPMHDTLVADIKSDLERGEKRMDRFEQKIDILIERQAEQAIVIQAIQDKIGNGLKSDIKRTMEAVTDMKGIMEKVCAKYDAKLSNHDEQLAELNKFAWFRNWITAFRDRVMVRVLAIVFGAGAIIGLIYLFERGIGLLKG